MADKETTRVYYESNMREILLFKEARAKAIEAAKRAKQADKLMGWPVVNGGSK